MTTVERQFCRAEGESYYSLVLISLLGTVALAQLMILPIMTGAFIDFRGVSEEAGGWIASANFLGIAVASIVVSLKIHYWKLIPIAAYGMFLMMFSDAGTIATENMVPLLLLRFLNGVGGGAVAAAVMSAIARTQVPEKGYGTYMVLQFGLAAVGLYSLPHMLTWAGLEGLFGLLVLVEALSMALISRLAVYERTQDDQQEHSTVKLDYAVLLSKTAVLALLASCFFEAGNSAIWTYVERIGVSIGISGDGVGRTLALASLLSIPCAFAVVVIGTRFGRLLPLTLGVGAAMTATVGFMFLDDAALFPALVLLFNAAWAFTLPYFQGLQADLDHSGSVVVAGQFATMAGASLGPLSASALVGQGNYVPAITLALIFYGLSWLVVYPVVIILKKRFSSVATVSAA